MAKSNSPKQKRQATGQFGGSSQPGGRAQMSGAQVSSMGAHVGKEGKKSARRLSVREARRLTVDPFTTHVVMEQVIALRSGRGLTKPKPDLAPRVFPGSRTLIGQPEKRLLKGPHR